MIEGHPIAIAPPSSLPPVSPRVEPASAAKKPASTSFKEVLQALGNEAKRGEAIVDRAVHGAGREISASELIALQAGVYRWVEVVDLASKLVDRTAQAVKTVTQSSGG